MITAGIDVGSLTSKAVIMKDGKIISSIIIKSKPRPWESADLAINSALEKAGLSMTDLNCCVGTGYGRDKITFVKQVVSEIACHAKGARWLMPSARTVIDIGGQDCKAMRLDDQGEMVKFITNDKCASGTGRFLEVMAKVMDVDVSELGELSARSKSPITLASACTVWAQADVIQHLNENTPLEDIAAGINNAMASRMSTLVSSIGIEREVCMTGGVAKNSGVVSSLEKALGIRIKKTRRDDPQLAGAIGAAIYAETVSNRGKI
jgi:(R)-2-hydroxyacyl-CoA dehydratese activating ATPase